MLVSMVAQAFQPVLVEHRLESLCHEKIPCLYGYTGFYPALLNTG
ncbi:hypothetical protein FTUN_4209 [Frigoriglobus tundricola]|uniref:Uncharacterized protein n=1 Tax=Frigoriglobus tundricola TaxID=2774151 RepID=A0A6M5YUV2_9BACT|nr:hypothetical protein FTUN_4209 [Frigoriglobus tundricola]